MQQPPLLMGIVNVTPDSFSDGGRFFDPQAAFRQALSHFEDGADIIDLGAESTRPGSKPISADEEWARLEPVLLLLKEARFPGAISIDTGKPAIMRRAVAFGVRYINDVRLGADDATLTELAANGVAYIAMHSHGEPETMQQNPLTAPEAVAAVATFYTTTATRLTALGFPAKDVWLDPGIGFGKTDSANLGLLKHAIVAAGQFNIAIGVSRKGFIGRILGIAKPDDRDPPTKMLELGLMLGGIQMIRTHAVREVARMRKLLNEREGV